MLDPSPSAALALHGPGYADWGQHADELRSAVNAYPIPLVCEALAHSLQALGAGQFASTVEHAQRAVTLAQDCVVGWRLLALGREGQGQKLEALDAYQAALAHDPNSLAILSDLGRLAMALGMNAVAIELFARALAEAPQSAHISKQLSIALRDSHQYTEAINVLASAIKNEPGNAFLWNALASVLLQQGDTETALTMASQALTLSPDWSEALYNRAIARLELGDLGGAQVDCQTAMQLAPDDRRPAIQFLRAQARLAAGDLQGGWRDYEARLDPEFPTSPVFALPGRVWNGREALTGASVLLVGEQGIGDEIMFAGMVTDLTKVIGPKGRLKALIAPRLLSLFRRSFPGVEVWAAQTKNDARGRIVISTSEDLGPVDVWLAMGSLGAKLRDQLSNFDRTHRFLTPAADDQSAWQKALASLDRRPKVGLSWKSMKTSGNRLKQYPVFDDWRVVLSTSSVQFVNLQYGDCSVELETAKTSGTPIWSPPGLDLTQDLEASAALSACMDLVIGVGNASTNLAAAVGVETWFIFPPTAWPKLGTDRQPWFSRTRGFAASSFGRWGPVMSNVATALDLWSRQFPQP